MGDPSKRAFTYFVLTGGRFVGAAAVRLAVLKFLLSMTATKDVLAMANLEVGAVQGGRTDVVRVVGQTCSTETDTEGRTCAQTAAVLVGRRRCQQAAQLVAPLQLPAAQRAPPSLHPSPPAPPYRSRLT